MGLAPPTPPSVRALAAAAGCETVWLNELMRGVGAELLAAAGRRPWDPRGYLDGAFSPSDLLPVTAGSSEHLHVHPQTRRDPPRGGFLFHERGVARKGLECCGVLTSEQGSDEPGWDSVTAFPPPPLRGLPQGGGVPPRAAADRAASENSCRSHGAGGQPRGARRARVPGGEPAPSR